jgi:putative component of toxin-antitoxin plasmid stabilization module
MVDVLGEQWDDAAKGLDGRSNVVGGDVYELRIVTGAGSRAVRVYFSQMDAAAGVKGSFTQDGQLVRVKIESPSSREVIWAVDFK